MPDIKLWEQYGGWAMLAVLVIIFTGWAAWKIYSRMADALDEHHKTLVATTQNHATAIAEMNIQQSQCINNNTIALTTFRDELQGLKSRVVKLEDR